MSGDIRFVDDIDWSLVQFSDAEVAEALEDGAHEILDEALELVPKRTGDLAESGAVESVGSGEIHKAAKIIFKSSYGHWVHEHLWFKHPFGGQSKFLEQATDTKGHDAAVRAARKLLGWS